MQQLAPEGSPRLIFLTVKQGLGVKLFCVCPLDGRDRQQSLQGALHLFCFPLRRVSKKRGCCCRYRRLAASGPLLNCL